MTLRFPTSWTFPILCGAAVAGWALYDALHLAASREPALVYALPLGSAVAIVGGAAFGWLWGRAHWVMWMVIAVSAAASIGPDLVGMKLSLVDFWRPRAVFLLSCATTGAAHLAARSHHTVRHGLAAGILAAATMTIVRHGLDASTLLLVVAALLNLATLHLRQPARRRLVDALAAITVLSCIAVVARHETRLPRDDQPAVAPRTVRDLPNLLLIVLDTVAARHLALYGYERVTTPALDAWVRQYATLYRNAYAVTSWTLPSHASLFTGLYPSQHGADHLRLVATAPSTVSPRSHYANPLRSDVPTLAEHLAAHGVQTAAIAANSAFLSHRFGLDRGFERFDARDAAGLPSLRLVQLIGWTPHIGQRYFRSGQTITDLAIAWLDQERQQTRPFFLFLNYMDAHRPYHPPPPFDRAFAADRPRDPLNPERSLHALLYDRCLLYLDTQVMRLLDHVRSRGLFDSTAIIITADHGEAFGEHGFWNHHHTLYEEMVRVPLYVKGVSGDSARATDTRVTSPDVYRLALEALGLSPVPSAQLGDAVASNILAEWYQSHRITKGNKNGRDLVSWMDGPVKWIVSSTGTVEAYDLSRDPQEQHALPLSESITDEARKRAHAWWAAHPPIETGAAPALDSATVDRLRQLGYVH
jgi:arylsulfatase A-like enzyme